MVFTEEHDFRFTPTGQEQLDRLETLLPISREAAALHPEHLPFSL